MAAHRFWRLYITENCGSGAYRTLNEVELRTVIGGADVTGSGIASASEFSAPYSAANAFDDNLSSFWHRNAPAYPAWLKYDFGAGNEKDIVEVALYPYSARPQNIASFDLQWSDDDAAWTTLFSIGNETNWTSGIWRTFSATDTPTQNGANTAWRVRVTAQNGAAQVAVSEVQMFETSSAVDACSGGKAFCNSISQLGSFWASQAFDNTFGSTNPDIWVSADTAGAPVPWIGYRFAAATSVVTVGITARQGADVNQAPKDFTIDYWDGASWQTYATLTGITGWASGQTRYFNAAGETTAPVPISARPQVFIVT